jgi:membrane carboxypeptidase/penicillin-binding protein PbpC
LVSSISFGGFPTVLPDVRNFVVGTHGWMTDQAGLAVALGGAGISLVDLVRLYAALSNAGEVAPLRYRLNEAAARGAPIFGPLAAWYVNDILAEAPPPPGVLPAEVRRGRRLAFKTGTSYGYRDFWAVGYDPEVTIGVWAGRPDGTPILGGSGRLTAHQSCSRSAIFLARRHLKPVRHPLRERCWSAGGTYRRACRGLIRARSRSLHRKPAVSRSSIRQMAL